jgi:hypothetical protein
VEARSPVRPSWWGFDERGSCFARLDLRMQLVTLPLHPTHPDLLSTLLCVLRAASLGQHLLCSLTSNRRSEAGEFEISLLK